MMQWRQLLDAGRYQRPAADDGDVRTPFERDHGRILFSNAFRRLHNKTQVFPLPEHDHVHSRLTHSLEVASVGTTLGKLVGAEVVRRHDLSIDPAAFGDVVGAACLAHDIGNPPFGHAGEDAIGHFFASGPGAALAEALSPQERADLAHFEGNAQGFRVLTRLSLNTNHGGMRLTNAVLGAFAKYPQASTDRRDPSRPATGKKFAYTADDAEAFSAVAEACGLTPVADRSGAWARHPLAFLMEAADDICYSILDLEDGVMLRLVSAEDARAALAPLLDNRVDGDVSALRARAISKLVREAVAAFLDNETAILAGSCEQALADMIPSAPALAAIYDLNMQRCYRAQPVLALEQAGYNVIGGLLANLVDSVFKRRNPRLAACLPDGPPAEDATPYRKLLAVTDFVSGMTDRYAVKLYHQLTGIAITSL